MTFFASPCAHCPSFVLDECRLAVTVQLPTCIETNRPDACDCALSRMMHRKPQPASTDFSLAPTTLYQPRVCNQLVRYERETFVTSTNSTYPLNNLPCLTLLFTRRCLPPPNIRPQSRPPQRAQRAQRAQRIPPLNHTYPARPLPPAAPSQNCGAPSLLPSAVPGA